MLELTDEEKQRILVLIEDRLIKIYTYRPHLARHKEEVYKLTILENKLKVE